MLKRIHFNLTIFTAGAVVLIVEILGTRVIAPFYGATIFVWSAMIVVTLGALALGYRAGGALADRRPDFPLFFPGNGLRLKWSYTPLPCPPQCPDSGLPP